MEKGYADGCFSLIAAPLRSCLPPRVTGTKFTSGPFEVLTDAGERGRETLVRFEEFRHALGEVVGETNLQTPQPVHILLFKNARGWSTNDSIIGRAATSYAIVSMRGPRRKAPVSPAVWSEALTRLFLADQHSADAAGFRTWPDRVLLHFRTSKASTSPSARRRPQPDLDWARIHLLVTEPGFFRHASECCCTICAKAWMRTRPIAMLSANPPRKSRRWCRQHFEAGNFQHHGTISSLPMAPKDFHRAERLRCRRPSGARRSAGRRRSQRPNIASPAARPGEDCLKPKKGLGLLALRAHRPG
jgi:hypothetical protein